MDDIDAAAVVEARKRKVEDPRNQSKVEERRNQLIKQGFRFVNWAVWERRFVYERDEPLPEDVRLHRMRDYEETVKKIDEPIVFRDADYHDEEFKIMYGNSLPVVIDLGNKIFHQITAKNNGQYRKQHWHMKELTLNEEEAEEQTRLSPMDMDNLTFRFHPELWDVFYYGEFTNTFPNTLNICSLKLTIPDDGDYSLQVYGCLKLLYPDGHWYQVIFSRDRNQCQTLTKQDPYLSLTGPYWHPLAPPNTAVYIQADLKLKGTTESDADKYLCLSAKCQEKDLVCNEELSEYDLDFDPADPYMIHVSSCCEEKPCECRKFGKHYLLEMTRTIVTHSVFASICVQLVGTEPLDQLLSCFFTAYPGESSCEDDMKIVLLDCRNGKEKLDVLEDGTFELSRQTICVDIRRSLIVYIEHGKAGNKLTFKPKFEGHDTKDVAIGSRGSRIQVKVEWSVYWEKYTTFLY